MMSTRDKIYNIPASCPFVDTLANLFVNEYQNNPLDLVDVTFLMPNRRACRSLKDAFLRVRGLKPLMLPRIIPIGDIEEDEFFFYHIDLEDLKPAISKTERIFLFIKMILSKPKEFGLENVNVRQACFLAIELAKLIDMANYEGLSFSALKNLVPEEYAVHWQETLKFLEIITKYWPEILCERGLIDPSLRYNKLLSAQNKYWQNNLKRVVIAGGIPNYPAVRDLVKTILSLPNGEFYINGLDKFLEEDAEFDETHPDYDINLLLGELGVSRFEVRDIVQPQNLGREKLVSEIMRPAETTDKWREIENLPHSAWNGLSVIECENSREEALSIAIIMREVLETPERTAALVTPDRNLARRVAAELERWDVKIDDSAGRPLSLTPHGVFMRLIMEACEKDFASVEFFSLLKHPFMSKHREEVREFEYKIRKKEAAELADIEDKLKALKTFHGNLKDLVKLHIDTAVFLASNELLWKGEEGKALGMFFADFYEKADVLGEVDKNEYLGLLEALMVNVMVRSSYGNHPRLKILGPIEARLNHFDTVIIGGVNDGIWPKNPSADPWMSRPMKRDFGFTLQERNIGIMAKDFASLLANERVYLTCSAKVDGTPMVKSRWLMRLQTVLSALGVDLDRVQNNVYNSWVKRFDDSSDYRKILPPAPKPPVFARPRKLSASALDNLIRDPYIVFAKYILRLNPLEDINPDLTAADYGNIIHAILDEFNKKYSEGFPINAKEEMFLLGEKYFKNNEIALETKAFWWPKFERTVEWLIKQEKEYRKDIIKIHSEIEGSMEFDAPAGKFMIVAKADRVDETKDGRINIIDYKTGQARSKKEVIAGYAPQLPIEGLIFRLVFKKEVDKLIYWKLGDKEVVISEDVLESNLKNIKELISLFDFETTPYISKPNPKYVSANKDYEHLARVKEWSVLAEDS